MTLLAGRYRLLSQLGQGGMGTVWRAMDELLRQEVAIKEVRLPPDLDEASRAELAERTLREARTAATLRSHPSIVTVHETCIMAAFSRRSCSPAQPTPSITISHGCGDAST
ncbi:hypothetical protein AB0B45_40410 [Nonomuraea sp. NPDC049152]|uniref:protein kinase domain-containing protein n=1 Tax=Nonomuraea sp. NPDC049152 TaxID=3154350 RepID=UPI0033F240F5